MPGGSHELDASPWQRVDATIMATAKSIRRAYDDALSGVGLTFHEATLVGYLAESDPLTQTELANRLGFGRASTGVRIDALVARGAVRRHPDPTDRRVWLVSLTDEGKGLAAAVSRTDHDLRQRLRTGISRDERRMLADLLTRLQHNLQAIHDSQPV